MRRTRPLALVLALLLGATAACGNAVDPAKARTSRGPIKIWLSNNPEEIAWGRAMVKEWNAAHPGERVTAQEIPAGKTSEEVIDAAIIAGTAPCMVFNTSPAAVPQFQKEGGLVPLDDFPGGRAYVEQRSGDAAEQYRSSDGKYYQIPWKQNPVMIFYNKKLFAKAGLDPDHPQLRTYAQFLATSKKLVDSKVVESAIAPAPSSEFFQSWFDFYPLYAAESGGKQTIEGGRTTFDDTAGRDVWTFWRQMYADGYSPQEAYNGDRLADQKTAMAVVGPWAIAVYKGKVDWGVVPVPTKQGMDPGQVHTFTDAKNISMYFACRHRATAWDVLKFATSKEQDGKLLAATGQMPIRTDLTTTYASYFREHPEYAPFAEQAARTVEVPNVNNSVPIWQEIRDSWSSAVVFGRKPVDSTLEQAARKGDQLVRARDGGS